MIENDLRESYFISSIFKSSWLKACDPSWRRPNAFCGLEKKKIDFSFINGQRVTSIEVRDVAHAVFKKLIIKIVDALELKEQMLKALSDIFQCSIEDPDLGYVGSIQSVNVKLVNEVWNQIQYPSLRLLDFKEVKC